jgi:hypothetical protein
MRIVYVPHQGEIVAGGSKSRPPLRCFLRELVRREGLAPSLPPH